MVPELALLSYMGKETIEVLLVMGLLLASPLASSGLLVPARTWKGYGDTWSVS
jgi:hypothetical protein